MPPAVDESSPMLIEVRAVDGQGRGYFAKSDGGTIKAGTTVLESCSPIVSVVNDEYENRNCRYGYYNYSCFSSCRFSLEEGLGLVEILPTDNFA